MAAPIRNAFNRGDKFITVFLKLKSVHPNSFSISAYAYKERRITTRKFDSFHYCLETVRKYDHENYLCTLLLPRHVRSEAFVIRAFNAEVSQVREVVSTTAIGQMRMQFWTDALGKTFAGNPPDQPVTKELAKVLQRHKLSKAWFQRLISSREALLNDKPFLSIKELEEYSNMAVVPVYLLILQTLGITSVHCDHVASHIGIAQGICNILRGIPYNASKGRVFLPLELMSKHRLSQEGLLHGDQKKNLQDAVYDLSCVAHQHLQMGRKLHKDVPVEVKPVFLPAVLMKAKGIDLM
ncbi:NADH dehydrogenase (ubiquinone) complex I, assembly factor 6-like isoform X2 [Stegodyphus dumicola]|uniref:NADH dehydrogenase (ubiquinone) complex I, assembly factor 6-like isoform X2 n=1 Tax=Stegodyphus dumicola TaxID=202533 RepID=UPI0015A95F48|nr:NADH dehydrogenase (ubiquinone) complex I, assembly factor 6-like isoform X2 [Stegodyphus dumicola]